MLKQINQCNSIYINCLTYSTITIYRTFFGISYPKPKRMEQTIQKDFMEIVEANAEKVYEKMLYKEILKNWQTGELAL